MASGRLNPGIAWDLADMNPILKTNCNIDYFKRHDYLIIMTGHDEELHNCSKVLTSKVNQLIQISVTQF